MTRPIFKKGDLIVHVNTGIVCEVIRFSEQGITYNTLIKRTGRKFENEWMNSTYYVLKSIYESPLYEEIQ